MTGISVPAVTIARKLRREISLSGFFIIILPWLKNLIQVAHVCEVTRQPLVFARHILEYEKLLTMLVLNDGFFVK